jgi:hormone-sensitive lipase
MEEVPAENKNQLSENHENDEKDRKNMLVILKTLRAQAVANMEYFQVGSDSIRSRFHAIFCLLHDHLERGIEPFVDLLFGVASQYDACGVRANGYRSLIKIIQRCCITVLQITRHICVNKESILFRSSHYCRELEAYVTTLGQLRACLVYVKKLPEWSEEGSLFANEDRLMDQTADELMMEVESLNQECFYGRCLGFQVSS